MATDTADLVHILISPGRDREFQQHASTGTAHARAGSATFQGVWERPFQSTTTEFQIVVDTPLKFDVNYQIDVEFYNRFSLDDSMTKAVIQNVYDLAKQKFKRDGYLAASELAEFLRQAVQNIAAENGQFGYLDFDTNGFPVFRPGARQTYVVQETMGWTLTIGDLVYYELALQSATEDMRAARQALRVLAASPDFTRLIEDLRQAQLSSTQVPYSPSDITTLIESASMPLGIVDPMAPFSNPDAIPGVDSAEITLLRNLTSRFKEFQNANAEAVAARAGAANLREGIEAIDSVVAEGFIAARSTSTTARTFVSQAELEAIQIGTTFGVGGAFLSLGSKPEVDLFTYIGLKFYFFPVDKSLRDPYLSSSLFRRFAFTMGLLVGGDLKYRGQTLDDAAGVKPLAAVSWDATRFITIELGFIFVQQRSVSPERSSLSLRAALFTGLSFDFDVFNRLKGLSGPTP